ADDPLRIRQVEHQGVVAEQRQSMPPERRHQRRLACASRPAEGEYAAVERDCGGVDWEQPVEARDRGVDAPVEPQALLADVRVRAALHGDAVTLAVKEIML